jgi:hypothetical protein
MRPTKLRQEIGKMRFEKTYSGWWSDGRIPQSSRTVVVRGL